MTLHDDRADAHFDAALEALARPDPPADHVARVLARTSAATPGWPVDTQGGKRAVYLRPRWVLPVAATMLAILGATWQIEQQARRTLDDVIVPDGSSHASGGTSTWGAPQEVVQPVLPPQAYWGMDPFREFATLRPGTRVTAHGPPSPEASARQGVSPVGQVSGSIVRLSAVALAEAGRPLTPRDVAADDELTWAPVPSGLPPIELVSITPVPLVVPTVAPLEDIMLAEIPLAPIVIAPLDDQEKP